MLIVLIGGARSGKSTFALELAHRHDRAGTGGVTFVATSPHLADDADLTARIAAHRAERPAAWTTIEETTELAAAVTRAGDDLVVVDCLTLWVSNLMWRGDDDDAVVRAAEAATAVAAARDAVTVVVTNEVGSGVHPTTDLGRRYRDLLGRVNQVWVTAADRSLLLVAGRALELHDPRTLV